MAVFTTLAAAGLYGTALYATGAAVYATGASLYTQNQAVQAQRGAARVQARQQQAQAARERRGAIRQSILARAQARTVAATTGQVAGTGFLGGMASLTSQLGANLGYGTMMSGLGQEYTALSGQAAYLASRSQMAEAIAGLGFGMVGRSGQIGQFVSGLTPAPTGSPLGGGGK